MHIRAARPEDADAIARVHVDSWRTTYAGMVPDEHLASLSVERRAAMWRQAMTDHANETFIYVAENEHGEIVGFVAGGQEREGHTVYKSELYAIYALKSSHGNGIGRRLMRALAQELLNAGYSSMLLWVLKDNPTRGFYEHMGGEYVTEKPIEIGSAELIAVAYGWRDIHPLLEENE